mmetsp:Transcript_32006/g.62606  ORF Transcript_32006/g.62606 Transcript_32006/m.62606 type:complete len:274 (+) Transcript_32006:565-1386(+)
MLCEVQSRLPSTIAVEFFRRPCMSTIRPGAAPPLSPPPTEAFSCALWLIEPPGRPVAWRNCDCPPTPPTSPPLVPRPPPRRLRGREFTSDASFPTCRGTTEVELSVLFVCPVAAVLLALPFVSLPLPLPWPLPWSFPLPLPSPFRLLWPLPLPWPLWPLWTVAYPRSTESAKGVSDDPEAIASVLDEDTLDASIEEYPLLSSERATKTPPLRCGFESPFKIFRDKFVRFMLSAGAEAFSPFGCAAGPPLAFRTSFSRLAKASLFKPLTIRFAP